MSKRTKETITLGSGKVYCKPYTDALPTIEEICTESNILGLIQGGATFEYSAETHTERDDLGYVMKIKTTDEEVKLKLGLITWNNDTLSILIDRSSVSTSDGKRILNIGGAGNEKNTNYAVCFHHEDNVDGDIWILLAGKNTNGVNLPFGKENGSKVEPEFTAIPNDSNGTLAQIIEEIDTTETSETETQDGD